MRHSRVLVFIKARWVEATVSTAGRGDHNMASKVQGVGEQGDVKAADTRSTKSV
jgi:hypothetical protein